VFRRATDKVITVLVVNCLIDTRYRTISGGEDVAKLAAMGHETSQQTPGRSVCVCCRSSKSI